MKINWKKLLRIITLGLIVAADRSAKVRRVAGKIDNWMELIEAIEAMAQADGLDALPYPLIRQEFRLSEAEAREMLAKIKLLNRAVVIVDVPPGDTAAA